MLEAVDKVSEEHERNVELAILLLSGLRALDTKPADPAAVTESFLLKLLSLSGFHPASPRARSAASTDVRLLVRRARRRRVPGLRGPERRPPCRRRSSALLAHLATHRALPRRLVLEVDERTRRRSRSLLFGFAEYHLERRMKSVPMLVRTAL